METKSKIKNSKQDYIFAVGRRREATARIRLFAKGKGAITVNGREVEKYFGGEVFKNIYLAPFAVTGTIGKFDVTARILGGGQAGQLGALTHGISRALEKYDREKYRTLLKKAGLLTRDSRMKERRKPGFAQKARAKKQSPKR